MKLGGGKEWFTAAELAELKLPGLPGSKRNINDRAAKESWSTRVANDGSPLARIREGARGGGLEYHLLALPAACRSALVKHGIKAVADVADQPETRSASMWRWFDGQSARARDEAKRRLAVLDAVQLCRDAGMTATAAVATIAGREGIATATIWNWIELVRGVAAGDRLPWLAPRRSGGGKSAEIDDSVWQLLKSDYLRPSKPPFSACYDRVKREYADPRGIVMPSERTLRRKMEREVPRSVTVLQRDGAEALRQTLLPELRSVADLHALQAVNIDGHKWDVWVQWPGLDKPVRPVMIGIQDIYSRKFLSWSIGLTESVVETRLALARLFKEYGIPERLVMDNGRAFASKLIAGGQRRFRCPKLRFDEEPLGILTMLDVKVDTTKPYSGRSKPIERAFRDFCGAIAKHPAFEGAYTGNRPDAKPENYRSRAIPLERFIEVVEAGIAAHNSKLGRDTEACGGVKSFDQAFAESYAASAIRLATPEQQRMALLAAEDRPTDRKTGAITMFGNRYWTEELGEIAGDKVTVRFDPDDLHAPLHVYSREGRFICTAPVQEAAGFFDIAAKNRRGRLERDYKRKVKDMVEAEQLLDADRVAALYDAPVAAETPSPKIIRPVRVRSKSATALKPTTQRALSAAEEAAQTPVLHQLAAGARRLRIVQ
ncbi:transposase domain-containing protein [Sphingomonas sp.]|uniref:transposase domain-containing protein n=1 Tax=Sphingomonas sp. TaxID=28214 RepID=UPI00307F9C48